jgi:UDP-glucose 4-epimerase
MKNSHSVVVIDNLSTGFRENVDPPATFIELDISRPDFVDRLPDGPFDAVCHLAAQSSGEISGDDPLYDFQVNAMSSLLLSRWCLKRGIRRFLYASSMAVYGDQTSFPVPEEAPCKPLSFYGISKLASEQFLRLAERDGLRSTSFRMFSVFGPGQNLENLKQGMVSIYLAYILKGIPVLVTGSLERFRDFIYIDDVIDAWMRAVTSPSTPSLVYNLGTGHATKVRELLNHLMTACHSPNHAIKELPGAVSDQFGVTANINKVKQDLGWAPQTSLSAGLNAMAAWARSARLIRHP